VRRRGGRGRWERPRPARGRGPAWRSAPLRTRTARRSTPPYHIKGTVAWDGFQTTLCYLEWQIYDFKFFLFGRKFASIDWNDNKTISFHCSFKTVKK
jgi:hypothetical protein